MLSLSFLHGRKQCTCLPIVSTRICLYPSVSDTDAVVSLISFTCAQMLGYHGSGGRNIDTPGRQFDKQTLCSIQVVVSCCKPTSNATTLPRLVGKKATAGAMVGSGTTGRDSSVLETHFVLDGLRDMLFWRKHLLKYGSKFVQFQKGVLLQKLPHRS